MYSGPAALTQGPADVPAKKDRRRRHMKCIQRKKDEKVVNGEERHGCDRVRYYTDSAGPEIPSGTVRGITDLDERRLINFVSR